MHKYKDLLDLTEKQFNKFLLSGGVDLPKSKIELKSKFDENYILKVDSDVLSKFKFVDLFCGVGGLSLPFYKMGAKCVLASDIDRYARKTYFRNYNILPLGDVSDIKLETIPDFDILFSGFPCQPYSIIGKMNGLNDPRGKIVNEIFRIARYKKPSYLILENVKNIIKLNGGKDFEYILGELNKIGYNVVFKVIKSEDCGSLQRRHRVFMFCNLIDKTQSNFEFLDKKVMRKLKLGDLLDEEYDDKYIVGDRTFDFLIKHKERNKVKGNGFGYSLFNNESDYVNTITSRYYKDGKEILIDVDFKNRKVRKLTPREAFRLQGFPESFKIDVVSDTQIYKQAGNSVDLKAVGLVCDSFIDYCLKNGEISYEI